MPLISFGTAIAAAGLFFRLVGLGEAVDIIGDVLDVGKGLVDANPGTRTRIQRFRMERDLNRALNEFVASNEVSEKQLANLAAVDLEVSAQFAGTSTLKADDLALPLDELVRRVVGDSLPAVRQRLGDPDSQELFDLVIRESLRWFQSEASKISQFAFRVAQTAIASSKKQGDDVHILERSIQRQLEEIGDRLLTMLEADAQDRERGEAEAAALLMRLSAQYASDLDLVSATVDSDEDLRLSHGLYVRRHLQDSIERALLDDESVFEAMVVGEAGHGKSSLLWSLHESALLGDARTPVLISASWFLMSPGATPVIDLPKVLGAIEYLSSGPRKLLIFIDTADLLLHDIGLRAILLELLAAARRGGAAFLLAVRPLESQWLTSLALKRYSLGPYSPDERAEAARSLVSAYCPEGHPDPVAAIEAAEARGLPVSEVTSNPLTLRLWFEGSAPEFPSVEADVTTIYRLYWDAKVATDRRMTGEPAALGHDHSTTALRLAQVMMALGTPEPLEEVASKYLPATPDAGSAMLSLRRRGVLTLFGRHVRFFHQTLFEFAAARALLAELSGALADALFRRVLERPHDLFLGAVLEQYLILASEDPLRVEWCRSSIEQLLRSSHQSLEDVALASWAYHPLHDVPLEHLKSASSWATGRFFRILPAVSDLHVERVLSLLQVLSQRNEPELNHGLVPCLERLAKRYPAEVARATKNWGIVARAFSVTRDDLLARRHALSLLAEIASADPSATREAARIILRWANDYSKRRVATCELLAILASHWDSIGTEDFLQEVELAVETGQQPLDRDSMEVRRAMGQLLARVWRPIADHGTAEGWANLVAGVADAISRHPRSPCANARLIAISELLSGMGREDPRIVVALDAFDGLPPPDGVWAPSRHALPMLLASNSPAADILVERITADLASLPAPPHVIEPPEVMRAALSRQVLLDPVVSPAVVRTVGEGLAARDDPQTWLDPHRLLALAPRAAVGGLDAARRILPRSAEGLTEWSDDAVKLLLGACRDFATADSDVLLALLCASEARSETSAIRDLLRTASGQEALASHLPTLLGMAQRLLRGTEAAQRAGALLLESAVAAGFVVQAAAIDAYLNLTTDPDARTALVRAAGLSTAAEPKIWADVLELCTSLVALNDRNELVGLERAFSSHREQVKVVEAARVAWLRAISVKPFDADDVNTAIRLAFASSRTGAATVRRENIHLLGGVIDHWTRIGAIGPAIEALTTIATRLGEEFPVDAAILDKVANDLQPAMRTVLTTASREQVLAYLRATLDLHPRWCQLAVSTVAAFRSVELRYDLQMMLSEERVHGSIKRQITQSLMARAHALGTDPFPELLAGSVW